MIAYSAVFSVHCNSGEIANVLICTCELVKQCRLSAVLISGKSKCNLLAFRQFFFVMMIALVFLKFTLSGVGNIFIVQTLTFLHLLFFVMNVLDFYFSCFIQTECQLITTQFNLDRVAHRSYLLERYLRAGCQSHIQQVISERTVAANGLDVCTLLRLQSIHRSHIFCPLFLNFHFPYKSHRVQL